MSSHVPDRVSLVVEFVARAAFAALAFAYFLGMPDSDQALDLPLAIAGLVVYLVVQASILAHRLLARGNAWLGAVGALADFAAVLGALVSDPFPAPPTLVLVLVVALNAGLRQGWIAGASALGGSVLLVVAALGLREQWQGGAASYGLVYLLAFMAGCALYFAVLSWRRSAVDREAARFADIDVETQLLNRRGFDSASRYLVPLHHRTQMPLVVMLASLDTRDARPLDARVLAKAVRKLGEGVRTRARRSDVVARLSDDEFVFMLFDTPLAGSETLARGLLEHFNGWTAQEGVDARVTFGMVNTPVDPVAVDQLIGRARSAVQRAQKHPSSPGVVTAPAL